jgi:hypothetical protein
MDRLFLLIAGIVTLGLYFVIAPVFVDSYRRYRNRRTIVCPDTDQIAEVEVKALHAGLTSVLGKQQARVKWCSLWLRKKVALKSV